MRKEKKGKEKTARSSHWVLRVFLLSMSISAVMSLFSSAALESTGIVVAVAVLLAFVLLGIVFDIIGFSVTAADPKPFHSMASHRTKGAKQALWLLKNADRVANFCNDVVGDICGIVSGTTAAVIVVQLQEAINYENILFSIVITALISGMTIGGKAAGKEFAMKKCTRIVYTTAKVMLFFGIGKSKNKRR
ncbi:MAG: hypothetical protein IKD01_06145 [Oscillospiraceae bacterium]|nr:hypothetical protein [Oscillospiraceae bacterium]MBR6738043.1 hypothetical protein [Oscillospiraceae bacterium]MBR7150576.1 hypothetical protein [Oscillospiraceae bacterium]